MEEFTSVLIKGGAIIVVPRYLTVNLIIHRLHEPSQDLLFPAITPCHPLNLLCLSKHHLLFTDHINTPQLCALHRQFHGSRHGLRGDIGVQRCHIVQRLDGIRCPGQFQCVSDRLQ